MRRSDVEGDPQLVEKTHTRSALEALRRRRQRALIGSAVASIVLLASGAVLVVIDNDRNQPVVKVASQTSKATNEDAGVSLELPPGWRDLPRVERARPAEVLVVGTADRPDGDPITACGGDAVPQSRSVYVSLYEYLSGDDLTGFPSEAPSTPDPLQPRPADFATAQMASGDCPAAPVTTSTLPPTTSMVAGGGPAPANPTQATEPATTVPATTLPPETGTTPDSTTPDSSAPTTAGPALDNHVREIAFTDRGRLFITRIVSVGDPSEELLRQGIGVVNTLLVEPIGVAPTGPTIPTIPTTTLPPGGEPPADEPTARRQIQDAMTAAFGGGGPIPIDESVEGGFPLNLGERKTASTSPGAEPGVQGKIVVQINWVTFDSPTRATVNFDLLVDGQPITANTTGYAVLEGGHWRMGRATWCDIFQRGGTNTCPTR